MPPRCRPGVRRTAAVPDMRVTRVRYYHVGPGVQGVFNQSNHIVTVETDQGMAGGVVP